MKNLICFLSVVFLSTPGFAITLQALAEQSKLASDIVRHFELTPDRAIPASLLKASVCVATVPAVVRGGFIFGASYGQGLVSCRVANGWSDPLFFTVTGGSWGWQIGVDSTDLVMVFVGAHSVARLLQKNLNIGAEATVAAGPLGRDAAVDTDYLLKSEIYSYSESRGLFAGLTLNGTIYAINTDANNLVYGNLLSPKQILTNETSSNSDIGGYYVNALKKFAP